MIDFSYDALRPPLGDLVTAIGVLVAAIALLWLYMLRQRDVSPLKRAAFIALRLAAIAVVAWILMGPSGESVTETVSRPTPVLIITDLSGSMDQRDVTNLSPGDGESADSIARIEALRRTWLDRDYITQLTDLAEVKLLGFDQSFRAVSLDELHGQTPEGVQTYLYDSVSGAVESHRADLGDIDVGGIVLLLSDGHDTQREVDPTFAARMAEMGWRIFAVPVGSPLGMRHVSVDAGADADFLFENQSTWINVQVRQSGFEHRSIEVELLHEGRRIDSRRLTFGDETSQSLRFRVTPPAAEARSTRIEGYQVVATPVPLPGETESELQDVYLDNNSRWVFLQVSTDRIKVAMFEGEPYWDTKFLARVLREDPQVELTSIYSLASGRVVTVQSNLRAGAVLGDMEADYNPAWLTAQRLSEFDVVILGKGAQKFFGGDRAHMLVDFVRQRGGALVLARGQAFNTDDPAGEAAQRIIEEIETVAWGAGTVRDLELELSPEGRASPLLQFDRIGDTDAILTELPDMLAATRIRSQRSTSIVLLRQAPARNSDPATPHMAAISHLNAGAGRVLSVLSDGMWRWAFLPSELKEYDSIYQAFWARTIRWLATGGEFLPGQSMSLSLNPLRIEPGQSVQINVSTRYVEAADFSPSVQLIAPDGSTRDVTLTRGAQQSTQYQANVRMDQPGVHQVVLTDTKRDEAGEAVKLVGRLAVHDRSEEKRDTSARPNVLAEMCQATGGRCFDLSDREALPAMLQNLETARQIDSRWDYNFDRPAIFVLLATLFGLEWIMRRRSGLL